MRNYCKASIVVLISLFVIACTKSGDNVSKIDEPGSKNTKPIATDTTKTIKPQDTTKSKPTPPVTTPPVTTKPKPPVTTPPVTTPPVTTTPKPPVTTPPVTTTPKPPVTTPPVTAPPVTTPKPPVKPVTVPPVITPKPPVKPVVSPPVATKPKPPVAKAPLYRTSAPISYVGKSNITISGDSINGGSVACIQLINCTNIHITRCKLLNSTSFGIYLNGCTNVLIDSSYIANVRAGVYAEDCHQGQIRVEYNQMKNMQGPYPHADFIQFGRVYGTNNRIIGNKLENIQGQSNPEDAINLYMCTGTSSDPLMVSGNLIRGGGPSLTGGGITVGDQGGSYETIENNVVVNSGYGGINCAGGDHIKIINNNIYSQSFPWSGFGLGSNNYTSKPTFSNTTTGNKVNWIAGHWGGYRRDMVYRPGSGNTYNPAPAGWNSNILDAPIGTSLLPSILIDFK